MVVGARACVREGVGQLVSKFQTFLVSLHTHSHYLLLLCVFCCLRLGPVSVSVGLSRSLSLCLSLSLSICLGLSLSVCLGLSVSVFVSVSDCVSAAVECSRDRRPAPPRPRPPPPPPPHGRDRRRRRRRSNLPRPQLPLPRPPCGEEVNLDLSSNQNRKLKFTQFYN